MDLQQLPNGKWRSLFRLPLVVVSPKRRNFKHFLRPFCIFLRLQYASSFKLCWFQFGRFCRSTQIPRRTAPSWFIVRSPATPRHSSWFCLDKVRYSNHIRSFYLYFQVSQWACTRKFRIKPSHNSHHMCLLERLSPIVRALAITLIKWVFVVVTSQTLKKHSQSTA